VIFRLGHFGERRQIRGRKRLKRVDIDFEAVSDTSQIEGNDERPEA
jgi:hypothetical protein